MESRNRARVRIREERKKLSAQDPAGLADAWAMIESIWGATITRARQQPEPVLREQVNGEWSFVQTQRHPRDGHGLLATADGEGGWPSPTTRGAWPDRG